MLQKHSSARRGQARLSASILCALFLPLAAAHAARNPCEAALSSTQGVLDLPAGSVAVEKGVSEWESEILKFRVAQPGVLTLSVESGPSAEGALQTLGAAGLRLVDGAPLRPGHSLAVPVTPREVYCLRVAPQNGGAIPLRVRIELIELCRLGANPDDHGDSFACATDLLPKDRRAGTIAQGGDLDVFAFSLAKGGNVEIRSAGGTDVAGRLFDERGTLLAQEDEGKFGLNFLISRALPAGRYYIRVEGRKGATGAYSLSLDQTP